LPVFHLTGLFHVGSVGIIMSGWLGAVNYGVIAANDVDAYVRGSFCPRAPAFNAGTIADQTSFLFVSKDDNLLIWRWNKLTFHASCRHQVPP
jgi:hypothetical protein